MFSTSFEDVFDLIEGQTYNDTVASVGKLSWFNNPSIMRPLFLTFLSSLVEVTQKSQILRILHTFGHMER